MASLNSTAHTHQAISASAGSGKTFQLAHRYISLLQHGVSGEEIVALTFSRKAAGEIFDSIVNHLCDAAGSEAGASRLASRLQLSGLTQDGCLSLLRDLLQSLHRLHVGTLDSFTVSILRSFPLELGIPPGFELMDSEGAAAQEMRQHILDRILGAVTSEGSDGLAAAEFLQAFAQASEGRPDKQVQQSLTRFITAYQSYLRALPDGERWGNPNVIWRAGNPWWEDQVDADTAAAELSRLVGGLALPAEAAQRWNAFISAARSHSPYSGWSKELGYLFDKLAERATELRRGDATVKLNRTNCQLNGELARSTQALMAHVVRTEMRAALTRTTGIHGLLSTYEWHYDAAMRRSGSLSFADAQHLLSPTSGTGGGIALSGVGGESRLYIDYRLDAHLNHWLLDEFQDTSDLQWTVLENLIDEVIQDDSGQRSLFYVGDVKQAIYGWRGGNPRLFEVPLARYPGRIEILPLSESFRSCPPIIDLVNSLFGDLASSALPERTVSRWQRHWATHRSARTVADVTGLAALLEPQCEAGARTPTPEDRYRLVACLLREVQPLARGLSTAVLVRSNDQGKAIVDLLRTECPEMTIVHEGRAAIKDNPVVAVLLALVTFATHPGDTLAWRHLQMSPLHQVIANLRLDRNSISPYMLRDIQTHGFQQTLRIWGRHLNRAAPLDSFGRLRLEQFLAAAGEFDASGSTDCDRFLVHIDHYELHDAAADDAVRVMTIHQAKGLGFDMVILPELDRNTMVRSRDLSFLLSRDTKTQRPRWALQLPRRVVAVCDDVLREEVEDCDADTAFESLCLLYVAMTRAKRALYVVTSYPGRSSQVYNQPALVKERLVGNSKATEADGEAVTLGGQTFTMLYCRGSTEWHLAAPLAQTGAQREMAVPDVAGILTVPCRRSQLTAVRPSEADNLDPRAGDLFDPARQQRLDAGIAVHSLLQGIDWSDNDPEPAIEQWNTGSTLSSETREHAVAHVRQALASASIRRHLARPQGRIVLWRERHFDVVAGGRWITGSFDRVVLEQDADGTTVAATLYDFKTDDVPLDSVSARATHYQPQMILYRDALAHILRLPPSRIRMVLLFTGAGVAQELQPARTDTTGRW